MSYQKFYTNPIQSSSLLCQLASMWKNDIMCDALIRAGTVNAKAHRVVMMAACPMLQSMEHAASGSQLEIRLSPDIKQQSILSFLQYLYEGFMLVTEDNYRDIEKIGRLLQVDSVIKCCADFCKSLMDRVGALSGRDQYRYTFCDMIEFRHVRTSELQRTLPDTQVKRSHDLSHDTCLKKTKRRHNSSQMTATTIKHGNNSDQSKNPQEGDVLQDSLELVQTEPNDRGGSCLSVGVGVISHGDYNKETSVVTPTEECCDSAHTCTPPSLSTSSTGSRTPGPSSAKSQARGLSPSVSSTAIFDGNEEVPGDLSERTLVIASDQESDSCDPNKYTGSKSQRTEMDDQISPDLSIVKVESGTLDQERHRLLEQEQVAAEYRDTGQLQKSRSSENMDIGQQHNTRRSSDGTAQRNLDSDTIQNDHSRFNSGSVIQRHSDTQPPSTQVAQDNYLQEQQLAVDHRSYPQRTNQQGKQSRSHAVSTNPYTTLPVTSSLFLPPISALSPLILPPTAHHLVPTKPPPSGLIDLSEDRKGDSRQSGDSQPPAVHKLMYIPNRKPCTWCQIKGVKTKSGWYCYASYKCDVCDVPLCKQGRVCFQEYHRHIGIPDSETINPSNETTSPFFFEFSSNK